jgi:excisionase family DNA binding protein
VTHSKSQSGHDLPEVEVFTLPEVAAYLRVSEEAVQELVTRDALPGQRIGGEWRFLKRAVVEWLLSGPHFRREVRMLLPPWMLDHPFWEELVQALEDRILSKIPVPERPHAKRGAKQAVLRHFGVFKDDADLEEQLAGVRARREERTITSRVAKAEVEAWRLK